MKKFIYVFTENSRDRLLEKGYRMLQSDETNNIFIFANTEKLSFDLAGIIYLASDTLLF